MSPITVRRIAFQFPASIQRYWLGGNPFRTHLLNSLTLLLPATEKWAVRVVKKSFSQVSHPKIQQDALKFIGQEGQHANAHLLFWNNLRQQGYSIDPHVQEVDRFLGWFESRLSPVLSIAILAGFEHLTEFIADFGLNNHFLDEADPALKYLFAWHAAEEIEHKALAYDVLCSLTQGYGVRILGLVIGHLHAIRFLCSGLFLLLRQDHKAWSFSVWADMAQFLLVKEKFFFRACANFMMYFRVDFHPSQRDNDALYSTVIERLDLLLIRRDKTEKGSQVL